MSLYHNSGSMVFAFAVLGILAISLEEKRTPLSD